MDISNHPLVPDMMPINQTKEVFFETGPEEEPLHQNITVLAVELIVAGIGVIFNLMVLLTITCSKHVQGSNTTKFIISLSVSDLLVCSFTMTMNAFLQVGKLKQVSSTLSVNLCYAMDSFNVLALTSSSFTVLTIAIDRYTCVANPNYYYSHVTDTKIFTILILVWTVSILLAVVPFLHGAVRLYKPNVCLMKVTVTYQVSMVIIIIIIPCIIICMIYSTIFMSAYEHIKTSHYRQPMNAIASNTSTGQQLVTDEASPQTTTTKSTKSSPSSKSSGKFNLDFTAHVNFIEDAAIEDGNYLNRRVRHSLKSSFVQKIGSSRVYATVTMCLVVGVFVIHWLPFGIFTLIDAVQPSLVSSYVENGLMWLLLMNSCWNPIIYAFSNNMVRYEMLRILCCQCTSMSSHTSVNVKLPAKTKTSIMFSGLDQATPSHSLNLIPSMTQRQVYFASHKKDDWVETEL